ncbi:hypothetical protein SteCoe_33775 [Stentor coeruleus]|uniref:Uncharacterized protein n=1 Tax=Stentor coeruleus TaxID=5963 RepID=A0A1R2AVZ5_9CILI|nr:hypothetical protein SteCoe_33775 [Stentor coeruleus]
MDELEFWIEISKKIGMPIEIFQEIRDKTAENYRKIQENLTNAQNSLLSKDIGTENDILCLERYFFQLSCAFKNQESVIMLYSIEKILRVLDLKAREKLKRTQTRELLKVCNKVEKRLKGNYSMQISEIISVAIVKIEQCKYIFAGLLYED